MKRLHWLVLKAYLGPFIMSFAIILFILVVQFMSLYMHEIAGKGIGVGIMGKLFFYAGGRLALTAMPIAILTAALMTYGSMGEHYELAAIKSSGISLMRLMMPSALFATALMLGTLWLSFEIIPLSNLKFYSLLYDVSRKKPEMALVPGHFYSDIEGYVIRVTDKDRQTGMLYDVMIYDHTANRGAVNVTLADSAHATMEGAGSVLKMTLYSGTRHEEYQPQSGSANHFPYGRTYFDSLYYAFGLQGFDLDRTEEKHFKHQITMTRKKLVTAVDSIQRKLIKDRKHHINQIGRHNEIDTLFLNYGQEPHITLAGFEPYQLGESETIFDCIESDQTDNMIERATSDIRSIKNYLDYLKKKSEDDKKQLRKYQYEIHNRYAMPINCLLFMLIGVSLGAIIRKGGLGMPSLVSITLFMIFYVLITQGKKLSKEGTMDPWAGAWLPIMIFLPLALYVTYQAANDAKLFDESVWGMIRDRVRLLFSKIISGKKS